MHGVSFYKIESESCLLLCGYSEVIHFAMKLLQVVNIGSSSVELKISVQGLDPNSLSGSSKTVLTSSNVMDENSFAQPNKVKFIYFPLY